MLTKIENKNKTNQSQIESLRFIENFYFEQIVNLLFKSLMNLIIDIRVTNKILNIKTTPNNLKAVLNFFQNHSLFLLKQLQEIACVDRPEKELRFSVTYTLYSVKYNTNVLITVQVPIQSNLYSVTQIYEGADWLEREVFDLFGIFFIDHKNLRRILTDYGFQGYPLRKDFPLTGFVELYYNDSNKRLVYEPVELAQKSRIWTFKS